MNIIEQILSIFFSILYGYIIYLLYKKFYKYLYSKKKIYSFFNSLLFLLDITIIYFILICKINGGFIKITFILLTILTFLILNYLSLQKKCKYMSK